MIDVKDYYRSREHVVAFQYDIAADWPLWIKQLMDEGFLTIDDNDNLYVEEHVKKASGEVICFGSTNVGINDWIVMEETDKERNIFVINDEEFHKMYEYDRTEYEMK